MWILYHFASHTDVTLALSYLSTEKMSTWLCQQIKLCKAQLYDMWCSKVWVVKAISKMGVKSCFFLPKRFFYFWPSSRYRGYYTVTRRYECYVWVAWTIIYKWAQRTSEILFLPLEHKIHIFKLTCNVFFNI